MHHTGHTLCCRGSSQWQRSLSLLEVHSEVPFFVVPTYFVPSAAKRGQVDLNKTFGIHGATCCAPPLLLLFNALQIIWSTFIVVISPCRGVEAASGSYRSQYAVCARQEFLMFMV